MALVRLADLVFGPNYNRYTVQRSIRKNAFAASGVIVTDETVSAYAREQGYLHNVPFFKRLANDEPNASSDDPAEKAVPKKIGTGAQVARKLMRNQSWSSADLNSALIAEDPVDVISAQVGDYWAGVEQTTVLKICQGILADNIANDSGDMVKTIGTDAVGPATDDELFGVDAVIDAAQTMGDAKTALRAMAVHSVIHARMQKIGALVQHFDPETGTLAFETFNGYRVIVDDDMPVTIGTNRPMYTSILFGAGAFALGVGEPKTPTEVERAASEGNGEGVETLFSRRHTILHPQGYAVAGTQVSAVATPNYATLASAAAWDRVTDRKLVNIAFLRTNG